MAGGMQQKGSLLFIPFILFEILLSRFITASIKKKKKKNSREKILKLLKLLLNKSTRTQGDLNFFQIISF